MSQLPKQAIYALLYKPQEPFDEHRVTGDWNWKLKGLERGLFRASFKEVLYYYKIIYDLVFELADISLMHPLIPVGAIAITWYEMFVNFLQDIEDMKEFKKAYHIDFGELVNLDGDLVYKHELWQKNRTKFFNDKGNIASMCRLQGRKSIELPPRLVPIVEDAKKTIAYEKAIKEIVITAFIVHALVAYELELQKDVAITSFPSDFQWNTDDKKQYDFGDLGSVKFTAHNSNKLKIFSMLVEKRGEPVLEEQMIHKLQGKQKVKITANNIRAIIRELRIMLKKIKGVSITATGNRSYKIMISASNLA